MNFKNYLKISFSNYATAWKLLLYRIIVWGITFALMAPFYSAIKNFVLDVWNFDLFKEFAGAGLFYGKNVALTFTAVVSVLVEALASFFANHLVAGIYLVVVLFFVRPFLMNIGRYVTSEITYGYMSSQSKHGFCSTLIRTLGASSAYSALRTLFCVPFIAVCFCSFYYLLQIGGETFALAMPFVFLAFATIVLSLKQLLTMGWAPAMVVSGEGVCKSFNKGIKATFRGYKRSVLFSVCLTFIGILLALGFGIFSLVLIVPICAITSAMYEMMHFFACQGMRYYTDKDTVLSSKRLEEQDRIHQVKFLL